MKYLGVDWGLKRIGLALSEGELASALGSLEIKNPEDGVIKILETARIEDTDLVILGKPEGEMKKKIEKVIKRLSKAGLEVQTTDETLSTQKAKKAMIKMGFGQKMRRDDNAVAAAIILQNFLDNQ